MLSNLRSMGMAVQDGPCHGCRPARSGVGSAMMTPAGTLNLTTTFGERTDRPRRSVSGSHGGFPSAVEVFLSGPLPGGHGRRRVYFAIHHSACSCSSPGSGWSATTDAGHGWLTSKRAEPSW